ncbi:hypothetical protein [Microvirga splendida]|uniref:Uncharacterized protein n=1 Tax=Microvirga splendida TaxID=2795727 RepID=A0ABS0Y524_9HYPH|nr:hypothetical protein [Microvirga splendida]MBJ6127387.1 hypothetical protein [Microvirga splendida]
MMKAPSKVGTEVEQAIEASGRFRRHLPDHTQYLCCYRTETGIPFAVERVTENGVRVWFLEDERLKSALASKGFEPNLNMPWQVPGKYGRNSNLKRIAEFKDAPLYWVTVRSAGEALSVVSLL